MLKNIAILYFLLLTIMVNGQDNRYTIQNLNANNSYSNFGTTFYGADKVVFASPKKSYIIRNNWKGNNQPFLNLYIGDIAEDGQLINVKKFSNKLNTRFHESDVAFTKDLKTVYFSRNNYFNGKIKKDTTGISLIQLYKASISNKGAWTNITPMPFNNDNYQTGHPTLSADEKTLYFISDMPGGFGKTDIYKASISKDGSIGKPINLGSQINTPKREMFPSISGNDELYFSSDGRKEGLGGLDLYVSKISEKGFGAPQNLGVPMNSPKDDFSFILNYETRRGYFSSNREGGKGDDDIYTFTQNIPFEFECNQLVNGVVTEKNSGKILPDSEVKLLDISGKEIASVLSDNLGKYHFDVKCNENYILLGNKKNFEDDSKEIYVSAGEDLNVPLTLTLNQFVLNSGKCMVKINNIYFDFDKWNIRNQSKEELDKVVAVMLKYPELIVEGGSHTDSRGTSTYNNYLSTKRAKSTVKYIIAHGIKAERISAKGFGESRLLNKCKNGVKCGEEEHQLNRRIEFVIGNYDAIKDKYPEICPTAKSFSKKDLMQFEKENKIEIEKETALKIKIEEGDFIKLREMYIINIKPILFDINSSYLAEKDIMELNKVVKIMNRNPQVIIECGSHTDSRASEKYNKWLSDRRAKRIVDYIISKGISPTRISGVGFGETKLINGCSNGVKCSEYEHQQNRRTEFVVKNSEILN
ncbi:MAG: OmpA family protein [Lutibacter sp.]|uniref:OmpA family protein n=1 Tax=Lutibacter sp. TaxID=1925666 RepID=UPI00385CF8BE